ncbi:MAG: cytochrome c [Cohaesibacter sp.]|nr:cytochrome c [Cohaesibacter sp.]
MIKPQKLLMFAVLILIGALLALQNGKKDDQSGPLHGNAFSLDAEKIRADGLRLYNGACIQCHGIEARGSSFGPPLVHEIYKPSHHSDQAFVLAALQGVKAHHWDFGDMPPVEGISQTDLAMITAYIRHLQRKAGIK